MAKATEYPVLHKYKPNVRYLFNDIVTACSNLVMRSYPERINGQDPNTVYANYIVSGALAGSLIASITRNTKYGSQTVQSSFYAIRRTWFNQDSETKATWLSHHLGLLDGPSAVHLVDMILQHVIGRSIVDEETNTSRLEFRFADPESGGYGQPIRRYSSPWELDLAGEPPALEQPALEQLIMEQPKSKLNISERGALYSKLLMEYKNSGLSVAEAHRKATEDSNRA